MNCIIISSAANQTNDIISWCNTNQGFLSAVLSICALIVSGIAVWISIKTTKKQNTIALFEKKYEMYKNISAFKASLIVVKINKDITKLMLETIKFNWFLFNGIDSKNTEIYNDYSIISNIFLSFEKILIVCNKKTIQKYKKIEPITDKLFSNLNKQINGNVSEVNVVKVEDIEELRDKLENLLSLIRKEMNI